jgi:hypothetical protein
VPYRRDGGDHLTKSDRIERRIGGRKGASRGSSTGTDPDRPITDFFDRLHELHLDAGEPGVRQIAAGLGRGVLSHTTVHSVFRGPKVPKWGNVELIIEHLGGDVGSFHTLWRAARLAELDSNPVAPPEPGDTDRGIDNQFFDFVMVTYRSQIRHEFGTPADPISVYSALNDVVEERQGSWVGWSDGSDPQNQGNPIRFVHLSVDDFDATSTAGSTASRGTRSPRSPSD